MVFIMQLQGGLHDVVMTSVAEVFKSILCGVGHDLLLNWSKYFDY